MISTRLAPVVLVVLLLALVPTVMHTYVGAQYDDGVRVTAVPDVLGELTSEPSKRNPNWGRRRFGTDEWFERWYGPGQRLRLTVVRTFDPKAVYHHPELAISYPEVTLGRPTLERLPAGEPVFVLRGIDDSRDLVVYALLGDGEPVENPYVFQATSAVKSLFGGTRPMTLVYVQDRNPRAFGGMRGQPAAALVEAAVKALTATEGVD